MAKVGAQRAAVLTGKSKSTIQRAMNSGKVSYELDQNGRRIIDVSELERVFGIKQLAPKPTPSQQTASAVKQPPAKDVESILEKERMAMQIKMLEQQLSTAQDQINDLHAQRDKWERQASQVLITSQYSQRQAEDLRNQIKEREERARQRRLQNAKLQNAGQPHQQPQRIASAQQSPLQRPALPQGQGAVKRPTNTRGKDLEEQMRKLKAQNENTAEASTSVFRFWKKAK